MHCWLKFAFMVLLLVTLPGLYSCKSTGDQSEPQVAKQTEEVDPDKLIRETVAHFTARTLSCLIKVEKIYTSNVRFDDELRLWAKTDGAESRIVVRVKPHDDRKGIAFLAEVREQQIASAYRYIPESAKVVKIDLNQASSNNVVIGGLSIHELRLMLGISPFEQAKLAGQKEANGQMCYQLDTTLAGESNYQKAEFYTSVADRLPVLLRLFNKEGVLSKEISIDKVEPAAHTWVIRQLTVTDHTFGYNSTFRFENVQVDVQLADSVFTPDYLKKSWEG